MQDSELESRYITINPLAAVKNQHYLCVICGSESIYLCKICRCCYCCREHLDQDNRACHERICGRVSEINEVQQLPLAVRSRPEVRQRLLLVQDECRRICYLQSRRHVLDQRLPDALPAAERSLAFAVTIHGRSSPELISPLLALADVASIAGSKNAALSNVHRANHLIQREILQRQKKIFSQLQKKIDYNVEAIMQIRPDFLESYLQEIIQLNSNTFLFSRVNLNESNLDSSLNSRASSISNSLKKSMNLSIICENNKKIKSKTQLLREQLLLNQQKDEVFRNDGSVIAFYQSKLHSSKAKVHFAQNQFLEAVYEQSVSVYFAFLSTGSSSVQSALSIYQFALYSTFAKEFSKKAILEMMAEAQQIFKRVLSRYYAPLLKLAFQMLGDKNGPEIHFFSAERPVYIQELQNLIGEYNRAPFLSEEERLSFRADLKEITLLAQQLINQYDNSIQKKELEFLITVAQYCCEEQVKINAQDVQQFQSNIEKMEFGEVLIQIINFVFLL